MDNFIAARSQMEGFAFFTEAIFLGIYLYGWGRVAGWFHLLSGIVVSITRAMKATLAGLPLAKAASIQPELEFADVDLIDSGVSAA